MARTAAQSGKITGDTARGEDAAFRGRVLFVAGTALVVGLLLVGFRFVAETVVLVFAGLLLATLLNVPTRWLYEHTRIPKLLALGIVAVGLICFLGGGAALFGYQISAEADRLIESVSDAGSQVSSWLGQYEWGRGLLGMTGGGLSWAAGVGGGVISGTPHALFAFAVIFFVGIYVAADPEAYREGLLQFVPNDREKGAAALVDVLADTLHWWLLGQLVSMAVIAVLITVGLWALGAPFPVPLGILAGLLTFVPTVGPTLALVPAVLLSLAESETLALAVVAVYSGIQIVESYFVTPLVQRRMVYLPPAMTITAQFLMWLLAGTLGLIVATPLLALVVAALRELVLDEK